MKAALLSCGESITRYPGRDGYDVVIAVNDAAGYAPCDYWSCGDVTTYRRVTPLGSPILWTHHDEWRRIGTHPHGSAVYVRSERIRWSIFSVTAALVLARDLGATRVECFGLYEPGTGSYFGTNPVARRDPQRWELEAAIWDETVEAVGVEVVRISGVSANVQNTAVGL